MTIDLAIIDIGKNVFTGSGGYGQVYVALSRVRSLDGLCILNFEPNRIKCHPKVIEYYNNLERASQVSDIVIGGGEVADDKSVDSDEISTDSTSSIGEHVISFEKLRDCEKPVVKRIIKKSKEEIKNGQFNIQTFFSKK
jgi:hypothetical protein